MIAHEPEKPGGRLEPFPLAWVRLSPGIFREQEEINARYLDSLDVDRLLHTFRITAGIPSAATPYKGWEDPTCELRGHFAGGHFLSAVALAYAGSANDDLKKRGDELVAGLTACQSKIGTGYLSAYPTELFERLAQGKPVWAPFYTYHKIMAGLLDMYLLTGNSDALRIVEGMAAWAQDIYGKLQHRSALKDVAHRVRRHERSSYQSGRGHKEGSLYRGRPPLRTAGLS